MNKKLWIILVILVVLLIVGVGIFLIIQNSGEENISTNEIQPEEEISDEQMRQTIVTLYYKNKETKKLMPEGRIVDAKSLLSDPYATIIKLLMEEPKNTGLQKTIPEGTNLLKVELKSDILYIDFSKEFVDNQEKGLEAENLSIYSIVNTLTELNEVSGVKILIDGQENKSFSDNEINFKDVFVRSEEQISK